MGLKKRRGRKRVYSHAGDLFSIDCPSDDADGFESVGTLDENIEAYQSWIYSPAFKRATQVVYLLKVTPTASSYAYLFCTDPRLSAVEVYRVDKARFQIEFIFRDSKQFLGLTHCQARDAQKINFQVNSVLLTLNLLKVQWFQHRSLNHLNVPFSVANVKQRAFNDYLLKTFVQSSGLEQTFHKSQDQYLQCSQIGLIAT